MRFVARRMLTGQGNYLLRAVWLCTWMLAVKECTAFGNKPRGYFDVSAVEEGWQPSTVTALVQDHEGYLWVGTYNGLLRYDGVRFTVFDSGNTGGLRNGRITSLYEDSDGILWIGHETGELSRLVNGVFEPVGFGKSWPGGAIEAISSDENRDVWLVAGNGLLYRLHDAGSVESPGGGSATRKTLLLRTSNGQLWIIANGQVATLDRGRSSLLRFKGTSDTDYYQAAIPSRRGGVWAVVNGDLGKFDEGRWQLQLKNFPGAQTPITTVLETRVGAVLAGTLNEGLFMFVPGMAPLHFSRTNGLSHDWVRCLCEDHEGNIWIGTGAGLDTLRARKVRMLSPPDHWQGRAVLSFAVRPDGTAWIGTEGAGLYRYQDQQWAHYGASDGLVNLFVWSVLATQRGELFAGTWGGGLLFKNGKRFASEAELNKNAEAVLSLFESSHGELWVGTTAGLHRYENGKETWFAGKNELLLPDVRAITETTDGVIWFGMVGGGLGSYKDRTLKQFLRKDGLGSDFVQCLLAETDGTLWIGTIDRGLVRLRDGKFATIGAINGLPDRTLSHLVDDGAGNLWIGSHQGIFRASKADLNRCADGRTKTIRCLSYGKAEGLASLTCSGGFQPGACKTADGMLWFPTSQGLAIIDPANVATNKAEPPVVIEELIVDGIAVSLKSKIHSPGSTVLSSKSVAYAPSSVEIRPGKERFEIRYTALSFAAPEKVLFRYKLEGLEREWREAVTQRKAEYNYLRPGTYTFRVIACNNDELWNTRGDSLAFTVLPSFWQTLWFQGGAILSGAGTVAIAVRGIMRRRIRARLEQLERQQSLERERARIARDIHDDLGASLTRISMLSQTVRGELEDHKQAALDVDQIYGTARELTRAMDEIVWAVNPKHDSLDSLVTYLGRFAQNFLSSASIRCRLDVPLHLPTWPLTAEIRHNLFLAFKEALNNVVKHARASEVRVSLELLTKGFVLLVADNGCGFHRNGSEDRSEAVIPKRQLSNLQRIFDGNGLLNMRKRLEEVGGSCRLDSSPGEGTRVRFEIGVK